MPDTPEGFSRSPYLLAPEFNDSLEHVYGAVGAGRDNNPEQLSAGCQFYIVANKDGLPKLDNHYTVYGQVFKGMDVVEAIVSAPKDSANKPLTDIPLHIDVVSMNADQLKKYGYVREVATRRHRRAPEPASPTVLWLDQRPLTLRAYTAKLTSPIALEVGYDGCSGPLP